MNVYIDKNNIVSFLQQNKDKRFLPCNQMLKEECDINFNFSKKELLSDPKNGHEVLAWLTTLSAGMKGKVEWNIKFPDRPLKTNCYNSFSQDQLCSIYLLDDDKIDKLLAKGILLLAKPGKEIDVLSNLCFPQKQYQKNIFRQLSSWNGLGNYLSPCTDIVIADQFLLSDATLYESNIYTLVNTLCSLAKNSKVNIVIFTLKEYYDKVTKQTFVPDWNKILGEMSSKIKSDVGMSPNIVIVTASKENLQEHDRSIFTNYKFYSSGDTMNYFDSTGKKITNGRTFNVYSLIDSDNRSDAQDFLSKMQSVYDSIHNLNSDLIHKKGELKCNFINL